VRKSHIKHWFCKLAQPLIFTTPTHKPTNHLCFCYHFPFTTISFSRSRNTANTANTVSNLNLSARLHSRASAVSPTLTSIYNTGTAFKSLPQRTQILRFFLICDTMLTNPQK
jgi:hypothetical protein